MRETTFLHITTRLQKKWEIFGGAANKIVSIFFLGTDNYVST